ncbi:MAG TPA: VCBS repeat-containing protein, partial [Vicinamibacterales bacterium]|nr:VCBS repeat-containing protein [Vicinamibacterales bacterium]
MLGLVPAASPPQLPGFVRVIAPFGVTDEAGRPYEFPFLGGFDVPRPQFADIDGDGDLDLFLQEYRGELAFLENTGKAAAPTYVWKSDRFQDLNVGEWYRFVDLDADGDLDVLAEQPFSNIKFYRNTGTKTQPRFEDGGALKDTDGKPLFLDRQNIPAIVDLDCDGRLDLFIGRVEGLVTRYEATDRGSLTFAFLTDHF